MSRPSTGTHSWTYTKTWAKVWGSYHLTELQQTADSVVETWQWKPDASLDMRNDSKPMMCESPCESMNAKPQPMKAKAKKAMKAMKVMKAMKAMKKVNKAGKDAQKKPAKK